MDAVFVKLFNMSMAAGWMILAVLLLRLLLRKAPHWFHCLLWGFVAVRLVCPVSFQSVLSLIPSTETINLHNVRYDEHPQIQSGVAAVNRVVNPVIENTFAPPEPTSVNPLAVWMYVAGVVWLIGVVVLLHFAVVSYVRLHRQVRFAARLSGNVWQCDEIHAPFILGMFRPRIYLPSGIDDASMGYVLAHERAHLKRFDHWWKPLGYALLTVYWFHPLVWVAYVLFCRDIELACDEKVIVSYDMEEKKAYSGALLAMSMNRRQALVCPLAFGEVGVKERVKSVLNYKKPTFWLLAAAVLACVVVVVCFLTDPKAEQICFQGQELDADRLSDETIEWLHWYNGLSEEGQLSVNFIPTDVLDQLHLTAEEVDTMDVAEDAREKNTMISSMLDEPDELPAKLYEGDGFSIYVPDEWDIIDDAPVLEESVRMRATAPEASAFSIWVACYEGQTAADVKARLEAEGYTLAEATGNEIFERMVQEEYPLWWDARLYPYDSDNMWVVFSRYDATVEWGSRLDALANTLEIK